MLSNCASLLAWCIYILYAECFHTNSFFVGNIIRTKTGVLVVASGRQCRDGGWNSLPPSASGLAVADSANPPSGRSPYSNSPCHSLDRTQSMDLGSLLFAPRYPRRSEPTLDSVEAQHGVLSLCLTHGPGFFGGSRGSSSCSV